MEQSRAEGDVESPLLAGEEDSSDRKTQIFDSPLHLAAGHGDLEGVKEFLNRSDNDPNSSLTRGRGENERSPLHCATRSDSPRNLAVMQLLLQRDKEDPSSASSEGKPLLANLQDASGKTALHYAAASQKPRVVALLLRFRADPNLKDAEGSSPLHVLAESNTDSALRCAELIFKSGLVSPSAGSQNLQQNTAVSIAVENKASKLLELFVKSKSGFDIISPNEYGYTPLLAACYSNNGDSEENLKCVEILLAAYSPEEAKAKVNDDWGRCALLEAAWQKNCKILEMLEASPKVDLFQLDNHTNSVFDYAIAVNSLPAVKLLCECKQMNKKRLIEIIFHDSRSLPEGVKNVYYPLAIALLRGYTQIAEYLLAAHPNQDDWMSDDELMSLIYSEHPTALLSRMDESLRKSTIFQPKKPKIYFRMITGGNVQETKYLYQIKKVPQEEQKLILNHPLVQILLEEKWKRIRMLSWANIFLHFSWIVSYTLMVYEIYAPDCHNPDDSGNQTETVEAEGGKGHMRILSSLGFIPWQEDCRFNQTAVQTTTGIFYVLSALLVVKECLLMGMKFWDRKTNLEWEEDRNLDWAKDLRDYIYLSLLVGNIVVAVINSTPASQLSSASELAPWQTNLAAMGILVAWVREVDNFPNSGIYSTILKTVLWNCLKTLLFYCPLLIGFAMCLRLLSPGKGQHKYLLFSLVKIAAMMTGELEFEDAFYGDDATTSGPSLAFNDILAQIVFLLLVFMTTIVVLNLLTGLAVKDVGRLLQEADFQRLSLQLDRVHMFESFILLARDKLVYFDFWRHLPYRLSVTAEWNEEDKEYSFSEFTNLVIADYSEELQAAIREALREQKEKRSSE